MEKTFDGNFSLPQLQDTLTTQEQLGFVLLTNLKKRDELPAANIGTFKADTNPGSPKPLILIEVPAGGRQKIIADQGQEGHALISCEQVFVSGDLKEVAAFR